MASDRLYEFNGQKGHWYTDEQGNRYFVAQGQTPKEGWEATKRRKMIKGGKYVKDDGDDKGEQEISANEYETYEADEEERFDATTDADFEDNEPENFDRDPLIDATDDDENERLRRIVDERVRQGWDQKGTHDEQSIKDTGYLGFGSLDALEKATFGDDKDEDGTNGWKPSEEATPAYDVGGFYSIDEGDRWEFEDGGFVEVRDIDGENVAVTTQKGTKRITKDELSDMVKKAVKVPGKGKSKTGESGPQTANIDANVDTIAKEVASKFGEANVKVGENGHILLKDPEGFDPVAIADEDEIPAGAIVKIMPNWREPNENPDDTYFVKEDRGDRLLLWSPSKSSSFGGYTYEWPKNTMYIPPRMQRGNSTLTEGKQNPVGKQDDSWSAENPKYKDFNASDATNVKVVEEGEEYEDPNSGKKSKLKIIEYTPYGVLKFGRKDRMYGIVGDDYEGGDTHRKGAIVAPSLKSAKEQLKEFTDYYKAQAKEKNGSRHTE